MRILHIPVDLGGHPSALAAAQRSLGHQVVVGNLAWSPFGFKGDADFGLPPGHRLRLPRREWGRISLLARSILWADVIHAHFGQTLASIRAFPLEAEGRSGALERLIVNAAAGLWLKDVALWRRLGKTVAMTFYGDDIRLVADAASRNPSTHLAIPEVAKPLAPRDEAKRSLVSQLAAAGVRMFAVNPDLMEILPAGAIFLPYGHVDPTEVSASRGLGEDGRLRFLHMPSDRIVKGTAHFARAVEQLRAEGVDCSLTLVENLDHGKAVAACAGHDVLLDQLHVGWYGGVAVEAMAAGLPVVAHVVRRDLRFLPPDMASELPVIEADPDSILPVLRRLAAMPADERRSLGIAGRRFVEKWHNPVAVANQVLAAYGREA